MDNKKIFLKNFAIIVVVVGVLGLLGKCQEERKLKQEVHSEKISKSNESEFEMNNVMSGTKKEIDSKDFKGGEVNCLMAGADLDFSKANINGTAQLEVNAMMGGVKIFVPKDWTVKMDVTAIMGGSNDDKEEGDIQDPNKTLVIDGSILMGGLEVKRIR